MKTYYKIWGNKKHSGVNIDFSRWLIGFGWGSTKSDKAITYLHFNLGPIVLIVCW